MKRFGFSLFGLVLIGSLGADRLPATAQEITSGDRRPEDIAEIVIDFAPGRQDVVTLRDGSVQAGRVEQMTGPTLILSTADGRQQPVMRAELMQLVFSAGRPTAPPEFEEAPEAGDDLILLRDGSVDTGPVHAVTDENVITGEATHRREAVQSIVFARKASEEEVRPSRETPEEAEAGSPSGEKPEEAEADSPQEPTRREPDAMEKPGPATPAAALAHRFAGSCWRGTIELTGRYRGYRPWESGTAVYEMVLKEQPIYTFNANSPWRQSNLFTLEWLRYRISWQLSMPREVTLYVEPTRLDVSGEAIPDSFHEIFRKDTLIRVAESGVHHSALVDGMRPWIAGEIHYELEKEVAAQKGAEEAAERGNYILYTPGFDMEKLAVGFRVAGLNTEVEQGTPRLFTIGSATPCPDPQDQVMLEGSLRRMQGACEYSPPVGSARQARWDLRRSWDCSPPTEAPPLDQVADNEDESEEDCAETALANIDWYEREMARIREPLQEAYDEFRTHEQTVLDNIEGYRSAMAICGIADVVTTALEAALKGGSVASDALLAAKNLIGKVAKSDPRWLVADDTQAGGWALAGTAVLDGLVQTWKASEAGPDEVRARIRSCAGKVPASVYQASLDFIDAAEAGAKAAQRMGYWYSMLEQRDIKRYFDMQKYHDDCIDCAEEQGQDPAMCPKPEFLLDRGLRQ